MLINPLAPNFIKNLYNKNIEYYQKKYNNYFKYCISKDNLLSENIKNKFKNKIISLENISIAQFIENNKRTLNYNIEFNNMRIIPEYLIIFEEEGINPFIVDAYGSYILFADDDDINILDKNEIIYDILGIKSNEMRVTRSGIVFEFCQYLK